MDYMRSPEPANTMGDPVEPVVRKIFGKKGKYPHLPWPTEVEQAELISCKKTYQNQWFGNKPGDNISDAHSQAADGIPGFKQFSFLNSRHYQFQQHEQDESGDSIMDEVDPG